MAKILVVYASKTGNTEKMAFAVAEGAREVKGVIADAKRVSQTTLEDLRSADGIIIGSPTYYGQMSAKLKALIDKSVKIHGELEGKVGAAFTSSGGTATGAETTLLSILQAMLVHDMIIQGQANNKHYGATAVGSPRQRELEHCRRIGRRTATLVIRLKSKHT